MQGTMVDLTEVSNFQPNHKVGPGTEVTCYQKAKKNAHTHTEWFAAVDTGCSTCTLRIAVTMTSEACSMNNGIELKEARV